MAKKSTAPAQAANADDDLPKTGVVARGKDAVIQSLQEQLASYAEPQTAVADEPKEPSNSEEDTFKKRYGDLRRHLQQKEAAFSSELTALKSQVNQLTQLSNQPMPQSKEEFEAWKAKYPQIAGFIEIIADEKASKRAEQLQEELVGVKQKLTETEKEKAYATLKVLVPDIEAVVNSLIYKEWLSNQPQFVQEELNTSEDPHRIAYWMDVFKLSTSKGAAPKKEDKLGALDASVKGSGVTPSANSGKWQFMASQIARMSPQEYEAREAEIIEARNSGRVLDDLSKRNSVFEM